MSYTNSTFRRIDADEFVSQPLTLDEAHELVSALRRGGVASRMYEEDVGAWFVYIDVNDAENVPRWVRLIERPDWRTWGER